MGGLGRIYFRAIDHYARRHGIEGEAFDDLEAFVRALDDEFIRHATEKQKADRANKERR